MTNITEASNGIPTKRQALLTGCTAKLLKESVKLYITKLEFKCQTQFNVKLPNLPLGQKSF